MYVELPIGLFSRALILILAARAELLNYFISLKKDRFLGQPRPRLHSLQLYFSRHSSFDPFFVASTCTRQDSTKGQDIQDPD